jgi:MoaA/NifB/PqqE/SkfB family radical SAM enzyme
MNSKFFRRTLRNVIFRNRPYFAHLALTHRCNLKCRFCHVTEMQFRELDTAGMNRVVDVLDRAGVAVISISGGGEPLLRDDFDEIINYASSRGLYVKLTSNGTMPRAKYERLLRSSIDEIGISLDGVSGQDLPFSHVGSPILATLEYLDRNLPPGKHLTINVTVSEANREQVDTILAYCAEHYPHARVWLNPVVVGEGALRTKTPERSNPDYLFATNSPTLLKAPFYARGAHEHFCQERFDWACKAGDLFFDVKPNGDYWFCQDQPSPVPLNALDPGFEERRKAIEKAPRRRCSGCIYSCYYLVQKSLEPRHWRDIAMLWWHSNTAPGGPERAAAEKYGPLGALACYLWRSARAH